MSSDNSIKHQIESELQADKLLNKNNIEVDVENGNVIISGVVEAAGAARAEELVKAVPGVLNVINNLSPELPADTLINTISDSTHHQDSPGSSGAFPVGAFDTSKE